MYHKKCYCGNSSVILRSKPNPTSRKVHYSRPNATKLQLPRRNLPIPVNDGSFLFFLTNCEDRQAPLGRHRDSPIARLWESSHYSRLLVLPLAKHHLVCPYQETETRRSQVRIPLMLIIFSERSSYLTLHFYWINRKRTKKRHDTSSFGLSPVSSDRMLV